MKKMIGIIGSLMLISGTAGAATSTATCVKTDNAAIEALFDRWNASLKTGDPQKVAENYLSDAVLLPTVSKQVRLTDAEREDYFKHFLEKNPVGHIDSRTIRIGCNKAIDTGTYTFTFADNSKVSARYTFTYAWTGDEWKISSHHSSAMPES
ncbi:SgcJ/EcaC family oxidoreductase [Enterobacter hormaechei]|uniref:SgcJ/EcaC family oxidoreductase n=1 Tax=Enterobacter hormaechei TaxID=158836 RepID=UPI001BE05531|nr:SgcJ/EcaC family oxidoreductase [Enterobacter hormaechei subsp. xiangfangensis]HAV1854501.1 SgcJ/EcaC family oxidoreductase [Enterobacter hormaechei subsp. xiangfangensis]